MKHSTLSTYLRLAPALGIILILLGASSLYGVAQSLGYITVIGERFGADRIELALAQLYSRISPDLQDVLARFGFDHLWGYGDSVA